MSPVEADEVDSDSDVERKKRACAAAGGAGWRRLASALLLGLALFCADVGLHLAVAGKYLSLRDCHRGVDRTFENFSLGDLAGINNTDQLPGGGGGIGGAPDWCSSGGGLVDDSEFVDGRSGRDEDAVADMIKGAISDEVIFVWWHFLNLLYMSNDFFVD